MKILPIILSLFGLACQPEKEQMKLERGDERLLLEVSSFLNVLSKLAPVNAIFDTSSVNGGLLGLCVEDNAAFRKLGPTLSQFNGNYRWGLSPQLPYLCFVPLGYPRAHGAVSIAEAQSAVGQDLSALTLIIENEFNLTNSSSLGFASAEKPISDNTSGPGGPAHLVSDPERYLASGMLPTSANDRQVNYWISNDEGEQLYEALNDPKLSGQSVVEFSILQRISRAKYEDLVISSKEIAPLQEECYEFGRVSPALQAAMLRIIGICNFAAPNHLGIVVLGE